MMTADDLSVEVRSLRDELAALRTALVPPRLALRVYQASPYLGQGATIVASVSGAADGAPLGGVPLTFVTTFGELRSDDGAQRGKSIGVRTSPDGSVRAGLRVPLPEGMDAEQAAFDSAIRGLNPSARTPADDAGALANLARQYAWEANDELRRAIDEYLREFGKGLNEAVTARDFLHQWSDMSCAIVAYITDDPAQSGAGGTVLGAATAALTFRNWLGAFLQTSLNLAQAAANVNRDLNLMTQLGTNPAGVVEGVYSRTRFYSGLQFGAVGELVGRKVADNALRDLLTAASGSAATDSSRAVSQAIEAGRGAAGAGAHLGVATARTSTLGDTVATKADVADVSGLRSDLTATIATKADTAALAAKADATSVDKLRVDLAANLATKADSAVLEKLRTDVNNSISDLGKKIGTKAELASLQAFQTQVTNTLAAKADSVAVDKLRTEVTAQLTTKVDTTTFNSRVTQIRTP